jgi:hypothetical protein
MNYHVVTRELRCRDFYLCHLQAEQENLQVTETNWSFVHGNLNCKRIANILS